MAPKIDGFCLKYDTKGELERIPCTVYKTYAAGHYILPWPFHDPIDMYAGFNFFVQADKAQKKLEQLTNFEKGLPYA